MFGLREPQTREDHRNQNLEPLTELLRAPALRYVRLDRFYFTNAVCHAIASALEEGSSIIDFNIGSDCSFPEGGASNTCERSQEKYISHRYPISKGVDVLSAVSDDMDCVFLHLLENPGLCDRRTVETTTSRQQPGADLDKSFSSGKRERDQSQPGKEEPRRRLA
jgi:hypothetical protein